jgi:hypothetical protein
VFCRYIATAHYLARHLRWLKGITVDVVTGELTAGPARNGSPCWEAERRLLVATDCLSEGVNLQER